MNIFQNNIFSSEHDCEILMKTYEITVHYKQSIRQMIQKLNLQKELVEDKCTIRYLLITTK